MCGHLNVNPRGDFSDITFAFQHVKGFILHGILEIETWGWSFVLFRGYILSTLSILWQPFLQKLNSNSKIKQYNYKEMQMRYDRIVSTIGLILALKLSPCQCRGLLIVRKKFSFVVALGIKFYFL